MAQNAEVVITSEIRSRNTAELVSLLSAKTEELRKLSFKQALQGAQGAPVKTHQFKELRRDIARLNTVLGEQARGETVVTKPKSERKAKTADKPAAEKSVKKEAKPKAVKKAPATKAAKADGEKKAPAKKKTAKKGEE